MTPSDLDRVRQAVTRCVETLLDDHARQGGHLSFDDVTRVLLRRNLPPAAWGTVWDELAASGISVEGFLDDHAVDEEQVDNWTEKAPESQHTPRRWIKWNDLAYPSHGLLDHGREKLLSRRYRISRTILERHDEPTEEERNILKSGRMAREELILSNVRLVIDLAKEYAETTTLSCDDLVQEGMLGLFRAVELYDPELGFRFSTYATWWIRQSIRRALDKRGRFIHVPVHRTKQMRELGRKSRQLRQRLGRQPTAKELASELGYEIAEVNLLLRIKSDVASLENSPEEGVASSRDAISGSRIESPPVAFERAELRALVEHVLDSMDSRAKLVLTHRYGLFGNKPRTLEHVARKLGITRERVRQIQKKALERIANTWRASKLRPFAERWSDDR